MDTPPACTPEIRILIRAAMIPTTNAVVTSVPRVGDELSLPILDARLRVTKVIRRFEMPTDQAGGCFAIGMIDVHCEPVA